MKLYLAFMKRLSLSNALLILLLSVATWLLTSCSKGNGANSVYNNYVEAYTTGRISRTSKIVVVLSKSPTAADVAKADLQDIFQFDPAIKGTCSMADGNTLVFSPAQPMARNTAYNVELNIDELFPDAQGSDKSFQFNFQTLPTSFTARLGSFSEVEDGRYAFDFAISSADTEDPTTVEQLIAPSMGLTQWTHEPNGQQHTLTVTVDATDQRQNLTISTKADDAAGLAAATLCTASVPGRNEMAVYDVAFRSQEGQRFVEVTFTKNIDPKQKLMGLAYIEQNVNEAVDVDANRLRLYPDAGRSGSVNVFVSEAIRSRNGSTLGQAARFSVELKGTLPAVEFVGTGTIVPKADNVIVPFRAIYLRGVHVRVFRIFENNMSPMLVDDQSFRRYDNLKKYGRPVAVTTIFFDEQQHDLSQWNTFGIDLSKLVDTELGSMYRIELSLDRNLSAWPSDSIPPLDKNAIEAADELTFRSLCADFDNGGWYYRNDIDWDVFRWDQREDPNTISFYMDKCVGRNVLATNIGLSAIKGPKGTLRVFDLNILDAKPRSGDQLTLFSSQNQVLATASTDDNGMADLTYDPTKGAPALVVAQQGSDKSYLFVREGELSTSTFDVAGSQTQDGLLGYLYAERGVWRPGDTIHVALALKSIVQNKSNNAADNLPENHPVVAELYSPLGQLYRKQTRTDGCLGLYTFNFPTDPDALTGSWRLLVKVGDAKFEKRLRIETIKPNRLKINLALPDMILANNGQQATLHTEWLSGAPVANLKYEVSASLCKTKTQWPQHKDFVFDDATKEFSSNDIQLASGTTDGSGNATVGLYANVKASAPGMLKANITTKVFEASGEFSVDASQSLLSPYARYVGIRTPQVAGQQLNTGAKHQFELISVDPNGNPVAGTSLDVKVFKVNWYWWWSSSASDLAQYAEDSYYKPVKAFSGKTSAEGKMQFSLNFPDADWGTYLIVAHDNVSRHSASTLCYFDWPSMTDRRSQEERDGAVKLSLVTDKESYELGQSVKLTFPSAAGAHAVVSIVKGNQILTSNLYPTLQGQTTVNLELTDQMLPSVFVCVSMVQPYDQTVNDMPIRLYGIKPIDVKSDISVLQPQIKTSDEWQPLKSVKVTVSERSGKPMAYTLAIVDEGLLDLTHFATPNPRDAFEARLALGAKFYDLYSDVAGAYGGRIEQLFSIGGDESLLAGPKAIVNRFTPFVFFNGPFQLDKRGEATHTISVPNYMGRVRVMVVAANGQAFGSADKSVPVTKPIMVLGSMPRQMGVGDEATVAATIMANKDNVGKVDVTLHCANGLSVVGDAKQSISFGSKGDQTIFFRVRANNTVQMAQLSIEANANSDKASYTIDVPIRDVSRTVLKRQDATLQPNAEWKATLPSTLMSAQLELSTAKPINISHRISQLMTYPHGCGEQIVSRAFPQLFLPDVAQLTDEQRAVAEQNVKQTIARLSSYVASDGGISYWPGSSYSNLWVSAYASLFLSQAEERGFYVSSNLTKSLANYLRSSVRKWKGTDVAAAPHVALSLLALAYGKQADQSTMNRMRELLLKDQRQKNALANASDALAAAYAKVGMTDVANKLISSAAGSNAAVRLLALSALGANGQAELAQKLSKSLVTDNWMSTYDISLAIWAMVAYQNANKADGQIACTVTADGKKWAQAEASNKLWGKDLDTNIKNLAVKNTAKSVANLTLVTTEYVQQQAQAASESGLSVAVRYNGIEPTENQELALEQGATVSVAIVLTNKTNSEIENVALTNILPAGFEVLKAYGNTSVSYQDVRDDRILSYFDSIPVGGSVVIRADLSATYAGHFFLPGAYAEAMYRPDINGQSACSFITVE